MTDYRLRNHGLLVRDRMRRWPERPVLAAFAAILLFVGIGVAGYLADRFNAAGAGFAAARHATPPKAPPLHLATKQASRPGS